MKTNINGDFVHRLNPIEFCNNNNTRVNGGGKAANRLTLRSCFDSTHKKVRALAQPRRLLHGMGSGPSEEQRGCGGTTDIADGGRGVGKGMMIRRLLWLLTLMRVCYVPLLLH